MSASRCCSRKRAWLGLGLELGPGLGFGLGSEFRVDSSLQQGLGLGLVGLGFGSGLLLLEGAACHPHGEAYGGGELAPDVDGLVVQLEERCEAAPVREAAAVARQNEGVGREPRRQLRLQHELERLCALLLGRRCGGRQKQRTAIRWQNKSFALRTR